MLQSVNRFKRVERLWRFGRFSLSPSAVSPTLAAFSLGAHSSERGSVHLSIPVTAEVQGAAQIKSTRERTAVLRLEELSLVLVLQGQELHALLLLQLG